MNDPNYLEPNVRAVYDYGFRWMSWLTGGKVVPVYTSTYRTIAEQTTLYNNRATNPYPVEKPGDSPHNRFPSPAADTAVPDVAVAIVNGDKWNSWELWTAVREALGLRVPKTDRVHGERPGWKN